VTGAATVGGTFGVTGNTTIGGALGVTGILTTTAGATVGTNLTVTNNAAIGGTFGVSGDTTLSGTLDVADATTLSGQFSPNSTYTPGSQAPSATTITLLASDPPVLECHPSGGMTVNLPSSPIAGQVFTILDASGTAAPMTNAITVNGNGSGANIGTSDGLVSSLQITTKYGSLAFRCLSAGGIWTVLSQFNS
jgi:hypothetical protein